MASIVDYDDDVNDDDSKGANATVFGWGCLALFFVLLFTFCLKITLNACQRICLNSSPHKADRGLIQSIPPPLNIQDSRPDEALPLLFHPPGSTVLHQYHNFSGACHANVPKYSYDPRREPGLNRINHP